ncbi:DUF2202 domain-containing protein [Caloranaerobacter sp. DY30410]|uniref:DUF2202 domain-containing protein n=1 Tax=Caloranaerobacter sp. DY30410 TaxID=3238305 RepID=UPI003D081101
MLKNIKIKVLIVSLILVLSLTACSNYDSPQENSSNQTSKSSNVSSTKSEEWGSMAVKLRDSFTLEEMLVYAIQDEYLARAEYEEVINKFGENRPFTSIIKAEETHIKLLTPLFEKYNIPIPTDRAKDYVVVPETFEEVLKIGVKAEIDNIAMYEKFLKQKDLPEDIKDVFMKLKNASENHLKAFQNSLSNQ